MANDPLFNDPRFNDPRFPYNNIEHLVTTELRFKTKRQGFIRTLYEVERGHKNPITWDITQALKGYRNARVAIVTGILFPPHLPLGEVDGTCGGAALARAMEMIGHTVDIMVEKEMEPNMRGLARRLGLTCGFVTSSDRSSEEVRGWADRYDIAVTIEKLGRNHNGIRHSTGATPLPPGDSYIDDFILAMNAKNKMTIGIGDGGNEIGFGKIHDHVCQLIAFGDTIPTVTPTKYLLPANVSNIGCYALTAAMALTFENPKLLLDGATVGQLIKDSIAAGAIDGGTGDPTFYGDDGIPGRFHEMIVDLLGGIVSQWNIDFKRPF
jgi:hypothetical protein